MPVLPYCVALSNRLGTISLKGILHSEVQRFERGHLTALYSDIEKNKILADNFRQTALEFHKVVNAVFDQIAVIPFRFPTWLNPEELETHLAREAARYGSFLTAHADHVQMELRISFPSDPMQEGASGTEHLRARAARIQGLLGTGNALKHLLSGEIIEWRQREIPGGLRLYALVARSRVHEFREKLSGREREINLRWSGPWPATEFLDEIELTAETRKHGEHRGPS